jgi:hypothetical protein
MPNFENNIIVKRDNEKQVSLKENISDPMRIKSDKDERHKLEDEKDISFEEQKLEAFAKVMGSEEYYIAGGLAQEIDKGQIEFHHEDIDIIIFKDQQEKIINTLRNQGFEVIKKPKFTAHDLEATNFDIDEITGKIRKVPVQGTWLYIGIYAYHRNENLKMAQRLEEDGSVIMEFPASYFDREKQTLDYKGNKVTVADLRLVASSKLISERPKDLIDVKNMMPILKERYSKSEIEDLKNISKDNIKTKVYSSLRNLFERFEKTGMEISSKNIIEYFCSEVDESIKKNTNEDFGRIGKDFLEKIRNFSPSSNNPGIIKKEFMNFIIENFGPIDEYYEKAIDKAFEEK